jgi:succinate dehydrogenase / fumarate reductase membrane anchor subunit
MSLRTDVTSTAPRPAAWETTTPAEPAEPPSAHLADYIVLRLTGLLLAVLVLGHFVVTHVVTDVAHDDSAFVARRLSSALWIAWDATMLAAAIAHGATGVRLAIADYAAGTPRWAEWALVALSALVFAVGLAAIVRVAHG